MNMSCMKNVLKRLSVPFAACGMLMVASTALAQSYYGDIWSVQKEPLGGYGAPIRTPGEPVKFRITLFRLNETFVKEYVPGVYGLGNQEVDEVVNPLMIQIVTGRGTSVYAKLREMGRAGSAPTGAVFLEFEYEVQPGDMALPMTLFGYAGSSDPGGSYQFANDHLWRIRTMSSSNSNAVWRIHQDTAHIADPTLAKANIRLQTVEFDDGTWEVPATTTLPNCRVQTSTGQTVSNNVPLYVWSGNTNIAQIVGQEPGQPSKEVPLLPGTSASTFSIYGKSNGVALIYLSRSQTITPGVTNYITKQVTVTPAPPPTVGVALDNSLVPDGAGYVTFTESDQATNRLWVTLSEPYDEDIEVRLELSPNASNIVFQNLPGNTVVIPSNATQSAQIFFAAADGTYPTSVDGVTITPVILDPVASNHFPNAPSVAKIKINNAAPTITEPDESERTVLTMQEIPFTWDVRDVAADMATGMTITWDFDDGTTPVTRNGVTGTVTHMYQQARVYNVLVRARDKDGQSSSVTFKVNALAATPRPYIEPVLSLPNFDETNGTGSVSFRLSSGYHENLDVWLEIDPPDQSNVLFNSLGPVKISRGATNTPAFLGFRILDGDALSSMGYLTFKPVITNALASEIFDVNERAVPIQNVPPSITRILGRYVNQITNSFLMPISVSKTFTFEVADVNADLNPIKTYWDFGGGFVEALAYSNRNGYAVGSINHTFTETGLQLVTVYAEDKDGGVSGEVTFWVNVTEAPTVRVEATPFISEASAFDQGVVDVYLTAEFTNAVIVRLDVAPINSTVNGTLTLSTNTVRFLPGETWRRVFISTKDGTERSLNEGFTISPVVIATPGAVDFYGDSLVPATVRILNEDPVIKSPRGSDLQGDPVLFIAQDTDHAFSWNIEDVRPDWIGTNMCVTWYWDDGSFDVRYGKSGTITHSYSGFGEKTIHVTAEDKDGGFDEVYFKIRVDPAKQVNVSPIGPILGGTYASAPGLGYGMIISPDAASGYIQNDVYHFRYDPKAISAELVAVPYKTSTNSAGDIVAYRVTNYIARATGLPGNTTPPGQPTGPLMQYDSFVYVWYGSAEAFAGAPQALASVAEPTVIISLPESNTGGGGSGGGEGSAPAATATIAVQAIFSREWRPADNCGDISNDGIPDLIANYYGLPELVGGDMKNAADYNGDNDFLPGAAGDEGGIIGGMGNVFGTVGRPFTAYLEVRGYHPGLNRIDYGSDDDMSPQEEAAGELIGPQTQPATKGAERPTDPTKEDTDGDGYPDGWEYFFWYNSLVNQISGVRYNPLDIATGIEIPWTDIYLKFDPLVAATDKIEERDLDGDGLTDFEEMTIGTNPIHWDTDGDGICDGWEIMRGLDPTNARDALNPIYNNPDGDYMAISVVKRELVTALDGKTYLEDANGNLTTWYRYGSTNETTPIAVGRPVTGVNLDGDIEAVPVNALILHFQVYHEFGFDPRTAWGGSVGRMPDHARNHPAPEGWAEISSAPGFERFGVWVESDAANTRPFTSLDEYLLMKFMSELRLAGAGESIGGSHRVAEKTADWARWSTHPLTPDTDASEALADGVPDGWELYVACCPGTHEMGISPWSAEDGDDDLDLPEDPVGDGLSVQREFAGTDSVVGYANPALYGAGLATVTITRPDIDASWINKFWPTDPWAKDTDGDKLNDNAERAFMYGAPTDDGSTCIVGGGLNPCSVDTDLDGLPDAFEAEFSPDETFPDGMDGTVADADEDWDKDGLLNYQEYYVQAVRHFRYDVPTNDLTAANSRSGMAQVGVPIDDTFHPSSLFTLVSNTWDVARYPWGDKRPQLWILLPVGHANRYVCTDPRDHDTDLDGMDDYYEMFHGLNPILGAGVLGSGLDDRVGRAYIKDGGWTIDYGSLPIGNDWGAGLPMDFMTYPWLAGMPYADPDADGLNNFEEMLLANTAVPEHSNTDPTPLWMTDLGFFPEPGTFSPESLTVRFYGPYGASASAPRMFFWPGTRPLSIDYQMFDFEMTEGFDTDNDGVSDKAELLQGPSGKSDPQDHDDPFRRQALWLDGVQSAAQTLTGFSYGPWSLLSFTVELWAKPEALKDETQVLIERPIVYTQSDLGTPSAFVRRNFQIGIQGGSGRVFARFDNAGMHDDETGMVIAEGRSLKLNEWVHIAARMDGSTGRFTLLINGQEEDVVDTDLMPANGTVSFAIDPEPGGTTQTTHQVVTPSTIVVGAANDNPAMLSWDAYSSFYQGYVDEVRIWDGARATAEIQADYRKRYLKADLLSNREAVARQSGQGYSRVAGNPRQLMPELLYHYTFDNLFSAADVAHVATAPRGFTSPSVTINKPGGGVPVPWWNDLYSELKSQVYTEYSYIPWIENGVDHLSDPSGKGLSSVYWTTNSTGGVSEDNRFPFSNDPHSVWYVSTPPGGTEMKSDLLPLGMAWAKQTDEMWDDQGASSNWADASVDTDNDGLPDWWEDLYGLDKTSGDGPDGWYGDPLGTGMTNGERYLRDLAAGYRPGDTLGSPSGPPQVADSDGDGMPDWWEQLYGLNPNDRTGENGTYGDPDGDGLSNYAEYLISSSDGGPVVSPRLFSTTQTVSDYFLKKGSLYLGEIFSDHDFMEDAWENQFPIDKVSAGVYDAHLDNDEDGWSNWAEARYSAARNDVRPDQHTSVVKTGLAGQLGLSRYEFPTPVVEVLVRYSGLRDEAPVVIQAFGNVALDGHPDATFLISPGTGAEDSASLAAGSISLGEWRPRTISGTLAPGSVQPGSIGLVFANVWTNGIRNVGLSDREGLLLGAGRAVGTINYVTGAYTLDLAAFAEVALDGGQWWGVLNYAYRPLENWPKRLFLGAATTGYLREGDNYFFAFLDGNNNGVWDPGEPCGMSHPAATRIGWDRNEVTIELTDYMQGYVRMAIPSGVRSEDVFRGTVAGEGEGDSGQGGAPEQRVRIRRTSINSNKTYSRDVFDGVLRAGAWLHEGSFWAQGGLALDWGLVNGPVNPVNASYEVFVGNEATPTNGAIASFTNTFDETRAQAVNVAPIGGARVYSARPTFRWRLPVGTETKYPVFALQVCRNSAGTQVIYSSGPMPVPPRNENGEFVWEAPIYANSRLPGQNGQIFLADDTVYYWRVTAMNAKFSDISGGWSVPRPFRLSTKAPMQSSGYGSVEARVKYYGPATGMLGGRVKVQVYRTAAFTGLPDAEYTLDGTDLAALTTLAAPVVNARLYGLRPSSAVGPYYLCAYIDHNQNGVRDPWESWGYANYYGADVERPYTARPVEVYYGATAPQVDIVIEDADTDQDWIPDAWEYEQAGGFPGYIGPAPAGAAGAPGYNPASSAFSGPTPGFFEMLALGTTDQDGDGLGDLHELLLGSDANSASTAADGFTDGAKVALGLNPADKLSLGLIDLSFASGLPEVTWSVGVERSADATTQSLTPEVVIYELLYTPSLANPQWRVVQSGTVSLDGVQSLTSQIEAAASDIDPAQGFFRVRLRK